MAVHLMESYIDTKKCLWLFHGLKNVYDPPASKKQKQNKRPNSLLSIISTVQEQVKKTEQDTGQMLTVSAYDGKLIVNLFLGYYIYLCFPIFLKKYVFFPTICNKWTHSS